MYRTALVIRATLDAFWSHVPSMVEAYMAEAWIMSQYGDTLQLELMQLLGPRPLYQHGRMLQQYCYS